MLTTTTGSTASWELPLLARANEAVASRLRGLPAARPVFRSAIQPAPTDLEYAYRHCTALTALHSRSFYLASGLLPAEKRRAVRALYAFCRVADDIVDQPSNWARAELAEWRRKSLSVIPDAADPVALAWADTRRRFSIPTRYAEQLLEGVAYDLEPQRFATFADLAVYAYHVAATVGLMSMHITGFAGPQAVPYAIKLGVALQLTNILRDVGEDWQNGRLYLPQEELEFFGLGAADIAGGRVDERWREFMRYQIGRTRRLYAEAWPGIFLLHRDGRLAIAAAAEFYAAILDDIEAHDYDVFNRRAHVSASGKLLRLPGLWLKVLRGPQESEYPAAQQALS